MAPQQLQINQGLAAHLSVSAARKVRENPKTGQVAKRESALGTAVWPEVRLVDYTEEAQSGVQGEGSAGGDPGGWHGCRAVEQIRRACQPDPCLEEDPAGRNGVAVRAGQGCDRPWRGDRGAVGPAL